MSSEEAASAGSELSLCMGNIAVDQRLGDIHCLAKGALRASGHAHRGGMVLGRDRGPVVKKVDLWMNLHRES